MHDLHIQSDNVDKASKFCWGGFNVLGNIVVNSFIFVHVELLLSAVCYQIKVSICFLSSVQRHSSL